MGFFSRLARPLRWVGKAIFNLFKSEAYKFGERYRDLFIKHILAVAESQLEGDTVRRDEAFARITKELKGMHMAFLDHMVYFTIERIIVELKATKIIP